MARRKNQSARRESLIDAAIEAGAAVGLRSLSLTDVAAQAGLTRGAILYYYDDLNALILEAHRVGISRLCDEREQAIAQCEDVQTKLWIAIDRGLPQGPDDALMRLLYEFDVFAASNPPHKNILLQMYQRTLKLYQNLIAAGRLSGVFSPQLPDGELARTLVALEDAYGLYITSGGDAVLDRDEALASMSSVAGQLGCPPKAPLVPNSPKQDHPGGIPLMESPSG